jgi:hypothetical protein
MAPFFEVPALCGLAQPGYVLSQLLRGTRVALALPPCPPDPKPMHPKDSGSVVCPLILCPNWDRPADERPIAGEMPGQYASTDYSAGWPSAFDRRPSFCDLSADAPFPDRETR